MSNPQVATILIVEDDPGHAKLIEKNLRRANLANPIKLVPDGQGALDYLFHENQFANETADNPLLMLLDLNMPVLDGRQVLQRIKSDPRTRHIPVIVLTTTGEEHEVKACYELGCNVFITKPIEYLAFSEAIFNLGLFLAVVTIPTTSSS